MTKKGHGERLTVAGLFAGIGGIERGMHLAGHKTELLCELDPGARRVLESRFGMQVHPDVRKLRGLPRVDVVVAGFPCQDLSQAGRTAGIGGDQSGLVGELFKRLRNKKDGPRWLVLENVPFMLQLQRGRAMRYLVDELEELGFTWAYRVVDTRAFGLPQRRQRVILVASRSEDPRAVLFDSAVAERVIKFSPEHLCGFYWTEGSRGLGWAVDAVPTLKGGSTIGIPSPPAIWDPLDDSISTPSIQDAERLQGFAPGWTAPAVEVAGVKQGHRWKLVGNAVSVPVAQWLGQRLASPIEGNYESARLRPGVAWPKAAWGHDGHVYSVDVTTWPVAAPATHLRDFLQFETSPLSFRAAAGFYNRFEVSTLKKQKGFLEAVRRHVARMQRAAAVA